jgi:23S rRNA (guanosine2251-2'-O)-methyltransferase
MGSEFLYGRRAVLESLRAGRRRHRRLITAKGSAEKLPSEGFASLHEAARTAGVSIEEANRTWLDDRARGANHQGVMLETGEYPYADLPDLLEVASERGQPPFLLLLDLIQDVQNVGTLLRTAEAVGVHGVLIQERRAAGITPAVVNASSGAVEHLHIAQVTNLVSAMGTLKKQGDLWFAGLDTGPDATRYDQAKLKGGIGIVVGGEGKGLRRLVRETCDFIVALPMRGQVESLNAATAGSLALYEAWRARGFE